MSQFATQNTAITGFGAHSMEEVGELYKALSIGDEYATTTPGNLSGGPALAVEDLDRTLKLVTNSLQDLRLWKDIEKEKVGQTVHQYDIQNSYGAETSPFFQMGSTPFQTDAGYNRDLAIVKYLGKHGSVKHNLTLIQAAHGPVVAREVKNKTVELLTSNERAMFEADSSIQELEYDGVDALIRSREGDSKFTAQVFAGYYEAGTDASVVIDAAGATLSEEIAEDACLVAVNNLGRPMDMYLSTTAHSTFSKDFYDKHVTRPGDSTAAGYRVPEFNGSLNFRFKPSVFNITRKVPLSVAVSATAAPSALASSVSTDASSQFEAADAGDYGYAVSAVYADGETIASSVQTQAVLAGEIVNLTPTYTGSPLYLNVFRTAKDDAAGDLKFLKRVKPNGSASIINGVDTNSIIPGKEKAYLLMHDPDVLVFKQLGNMIKYDLAVIDTSYRWLQLMYGMVVIQQPRKNVIIDNLAQK
jgi:hypothetical protein